MQRVVNFEYDPRTLAFVQTPCTIHVIIPISRFLEAIWTLKPKSLDSTLSDEVNAPICNYSVLISTPCILK